jgi:hypothetical protein
VAFITFAPTPTLNVVTIGGGPAASIATVAGSTIESGGVAWGTDGYLYATGPEGGLVRVLPGGGSLEPVTVPDTAGGETKHLWPDPITGGRYVLFTIRFATGTSLTVGQEKLQAFYDDLEFFRPRVLLRPQEITNNPEVVRRLGIITVNTAIEVDIFGNVNSTHVMGSSIMNGIGGSGDFTRNAHISIFTCPSAAKGGKISTIVPLVSHMDHSEHSVHVVVTEQGVADLRGKDPNERARLMVQTCAHPEYRDDLLRYFEMAKDGHSPQTLANAFLMHQQFLQSGDMHGVKWIP